MNMTGISTISGGNAEVHLIKDSSKNSQATMHHHKHIYCDKARFIKYIPFFFKKEKNLFIIDFIVIR